MSWRFQWLEGAHVVRDPAWYAQWSSRVAEARTARIFDEPVMIRMWAETIGHARDAAFRFCVAESEAGNVVQIPFFVLPSRFSNLMTRRMFAMGEPHFDYQDPLSVGELPPDETFWVDLGAELERGRFCEEATVMRISTPASKETFTEDGAKISPLITLDEFDSWEGFLKSRPQKHRTDVRRQTRRLAMEGPLTLKVFKANEQSEAAGEFLQLRAAYEELWTGSPSFGLFQAPGTWAFYERMLNDLLPTGMLHFSVLRVGNESVAWHFGFLHRGRLHYYKPTYRKAWEAFSPGKVLLSMLIQLGFESNWKEFDFGCGGESYKLRWTDKMLPLYRWHWTSSSLRSRLCESARRIVRGCRVTSSLRIDDLTAEGNSNRLSATLITTRGDMRSDTRVAKRCGEQTLHDWRNRRTDDALRTTEAQQTRTNNFVVSQLISQDLSEWYGAGNWKDCQGRRLLCADLQCSFEIIRFDTKDYQPAIRQIGSRTTDVIVEYTFHPRLIEAIKKNRPDVRIHVRAHNAEALQHLHRHPPTMWPTRSNCRILYGTARLALQDRHCASLADSVLGISDWDQRHYWQRIAPRARFQYLPYFSPWPDLRPTVQPEMWENRQNRIVCMPGGLDRLSQQQRQNFFSLAQSLQDVAGAVAPEFGITDHHNESFVAPSNVVLLGQVPEPWDLLCQSKGLAVLTDLGFGMKTTIPDALAAGCHVFVHKGLMSRLPEIIRQHCVPIDPRDMQKSATAVLATLGSMPSRVTDVNAELRICSLNALKSVLSPHCINHETPV